MNLFWFFLLLPMLLLLIIVVAILSVRWERRFRARQEQQAVAGPSAVQETVTALQSKWQEWQAHLPALEHFKSLSNGLQPQASPTDLPARFLAWADQALTDDPALQAWLRQLPPQGQLIITQRLAAFCTDIGFELTWLLDRHLALDKEVEAGACQVVRDYCRACYQAVPIFSDLQLLQPYLLLRETPANRTNRPFGQQLYTQLVAAGLAAPLPADLALATETVRWDYVSQAIEQAAATHPSELAVIVKELTQAATTPPEPAAPAPVAPQPAPAG
jgi:hypothetical protein